MISGQGTLFLAGLIWVPVHSWSLALACCILPGLVWVFPFAAAPCPLPSVLFSFPLFRCPQKILGKLSQNEGRVGQRTPPQTNDSPALGLETTLAILLIFNHRMNLIDGIPIFLAAIKFVCDFVPWKSNIDETLPTDSNDFILGLHLGSPGRLKNKQETRFAWGLAPRIEPRKQRPKLGAVANIAGKARVSELKILSS